MRRQQEKTKKKNILLPVVLLAISCIAAVELLVCSVADPVLRSEEHTSELQSQSVISYAVFCLKKIFFNDTATTEIYTICYTLSLHDALPIFSILWTKSRVA